MPRKGKYPRETEVAFHVPTMEVKGAIVQEVPELLPWCAQWGVHMPSAKIFKHRQLEKCHKAT